MLEVLFIIGFLLATGIFNYKTLKNDKKEKWLFLTFCIITALSSVFLIYDQVMFRYTDLLSNTFGSITERMVGK
ncbi:hypothetical protein [Evansella clarkii]|uniref:hypothetical protein n=1 Tax=Evansella clarkii TaxID=79879 RepID=UPI00099880C3|nr:hypothetical protein [Evansella clarkii]